MHKDMQGTSTHLGYTCKSKGAGAWGPNIWVCVTSMSLTFTDSGDRGLG